MPALAARVLLHTGKSPCVPLGEEPARRQEPSRRPSRRTPPHRAPAHPASRRLPSPIAPQQPQNELDVRLRQACASQFARFAVRCFGEVAQAGAPKDGAARAPRRGTSALRPSGVSTEKPAATSPNQPFPVARGFVGLLASGRRAARYHHAAWRVSRYPSWLTWSTTASVGFSSSRSAWGLEPRPSPHRLLADEEKRRSAASTAREAHNNDEGAGRGARCGPQL